MIYARPQCCDCRHLSQEEGPLRCTAFPAGVPEAIEVGDHDHPSAGVAAPPTVQQVE
jgi:hypothetical protein